VVLMAASELGGFAGLPVAIATHSAIWTSAAVSAGTTIGAAGAVATVAMIRRGGAARAVGSFVRACVPLGVSQLFIVLGTRFDTVLAGAVSGLLAAGTFEGAWRVYQLGQYVVGGLATAAAPFVADALGAGRHDEAVALLRRLIVRMLVLGAILGALLYLGRYPIARVLAGSLAGQVAAVLPIIAVLSPVAAVGLVGFFTLISREGERGYVLAVHAIGAAVNVVVVVLLGGTHGARGVTFGCAAGIAVTDVLMLIRLRSVVRGLDAEPRGLPAAQAGLVQRP
jgi:O-antigen/teichoic acid export membrane protein